MRRLTDLDSHYHASILASIVALDVAALGFLPSSHAACAMLVVWGDPILPIVLDLAGVAHADIAPLHRLYRFYEERWPLAKSLQIVGEMHEQYARRVQEANAKPPPTRSRYCPLTPKFFSPCNPTRPRFSTS